jgi:hypothetical protein
MPVTDFGSDWNSPYRLPQGWTPYPDGSAGPSSGLPDWLKQLIPSPGASVPNAPGLQNGAGPQGVMPGGGLMGLPASTPGGPSMGFPAQGGAGGLLSALAGGNPYARAAIAAGGVLQPTPAETGELPLSMSGARPMRPRSTGAMPGAGMAGAAGADGGFNNPYAAAAAANPPQGGPYVGSGASPMATQPGPAPAGVGGPYVGGQGPTPIDRNNPLPWQSASSATAGPTPTGSPSQTPRPGGSGAGSPLPPRRPKNLGVTPSGNVAPPSSNPRFGTMQSQVPSGRGPLSSNPIYTTLNLANLFGGK